MRSTPAASAPDYELTLRRAPFGQRFAIVTSQHAGASQLERNTQAFLDALAAKGGEPIYKLSVPQARQVLEDAQSGPVAKLPADKQTLTFNDANAGPVSITIIRPQGITGTLPAVLYIHGAGWVLGSENTHDRLVRQLAAGTRVRRPGEEVTTRRPGSI